MPIIFRSFVFITFLISFSSLAEIISIPMQYTNRPARDLTDENGKTLSVMQSRAIWDKTKDLSQLNPKETDIWKNEIGRQLLAQEDDLNINPQEEFHYIDKVISTVGSYRFVVREAEASSEKRNFNIWLSTDSRSILLRKNLLRKLGYRVPKILHQQELKLKFKGKASLNAFLEEVEISTFADVNRWRIHTDEENFVITLQDVLILESNTKIYNLAMGEISSETIAHRRSLNSLATPYALVDLRESVDGFPWSLGKIDNKVMLLDIISGDAFSTTYFDTLWMLKRLKDLTRQDFQEIVDLAYFPESVALLMVEKLLARRNAITKLFFSDAVDTPVDYEVSGATGELIKGRLTQEKWPGHAARYSFDDTESPLSKDEMLAYFRSKFYSGVLGNLVSYVNKNLLYETDIQKVAIEKAVEAQKEQFLEFFETGQFKRVPFTAWAIPTAKGHILASRDIVTGAYLGTDNLIQIADSLEFIGEVGAFVGTLGLPSRVQLFASGSARFSRAYTHVKSIKSIKTALKEPFRNIIVPNVKRKKTQTIVEMIDSLQSPEFAKLTGEERDAEVKNIFKEFNKVLQLGDSLIISNNLILSGAGVLGYQIPLNFANIEASIQLGMNKINIWRLNITRSGENTFQVYKSRANSFGKNAGIQLSAYVPIITLNWNKQKGKIVTEFHSLDFDSQEETKDTIRKLVELREVFAENSTELITKTKKPFIIQHNFVEKLSQRRWFSKQKTKIKLSDKLKITHPEGYQTELYIRNIAKLKGKNYIQVAYDVLNGIIKEIFENDSVNFSNAESGNPGDSFYGQSYSRQITTEVPFNNEISEIPFENYSQIKHQWKGWSGKRSKLISIKKKIDKKYGKNIFNDELFYGTKKIKLYTVDVVLSLYANGINHLLNFDHKKFMDIIDANLIVPWRGSRTTNSRFGKENAVTKRKRKREKLIELIDSVHKSLQSEYRHLMNPKKKSQNITKLIDTIEMMLPFKTFQTLVGGDKNFYLKGVINGFRVGTENGEEAILSNSIGEYGSEFTGGIINTLRNAIKISQGELGAYWFLRRVQ